MGKDQGNLKSIGAAMFCGLMLNQPAQAFELEFLDGELTVDVRNQWSYGASMSVEKPEKDYIWGLPSRHVTTNDADIATGHGGGGGNINGDDGRLIYDKGDVYQNQFKGITDFRASWGDFGAIVKVLYFYDTAVVNNGTQLITEPHNTYTNLDGNGGGAPVDTGQRATREVTFSSDAISEIGKDLRTTEAFAYYDGYVGDIAETGTFLDDIALTVRLGDQIVRWGQSTFAPGINIFNPLDANRALVPGFDLAELQKPVGGLFVSAAITDWLTIEAWTGYDFQPLQIPPGGSFFTFYDPAGAGVDGYSGQGNGFCAPFTQHEAAWDQVNGHPGGLGGSCIPLSRADFAKNDDMYGLKVAFALPFELVNTFELYALKFNNTFPVVNVNQSGVLPNAVPCELVDKLLYEAGDNEGRVLGQAILTSNGSSNAAGGVDDGPNTNTEDAGCRGVAVFTQDVASLRTRKAAGDFLDAGLKWVAGLDGFGFAWSGNLPFGGIAWNGEFSFKKDFPLQVAVGEILSVNGHVHNNTTNTSAAFGGFTVNPTLTARETDDLTNGYLYIPRNINCFDWGLTCAPAQGINGQLGGADPVQGVGSSQDAGIVDGGLALGASPQGTPAQGWWPMDVYQLNLGFTKIFSNLLWQDNIILLWEGVASYVDGMDDYSFGFDAPNLKLIEPLLEPTADDFGYGYRMALIMQRPALMGTKVDLETTWIFFHDVKGTTVTNLNMFVEDRMQTILQFNFKYGTFLTQFRYLGFFGAKDQNPFIDRDTVQVNFKYTL